MISREELLAWLGDYRPLLDEDQVERIHAEAEDIERRWPGPDYAPEREVALLATVQWVLGQTTTMAAGADVQDAQERLALAIAAARQTARLAVIDGANPDHAAVEAGVDPGLLRRDLAG